MPQTTIIFGPPGTGKTRAALDEIGREIAAGTAPSRIAFVSFTKRAVREAIDRAEVKFGLDEDDFPWFRTLHSAAYRAKGLRRDAIMSGENYAELGAALGVEFSHKRADVDDAPFIQPDAYLTGDVLLGIYARAAATGSGVDDAIMTHHLGGGKIDASLIKKFFSWLSAYKMDTHKVDFSDMLDGAPPIDIDVAVIDEAQDCTPQQWAAARAMFGGAKRWCVAGDDDQAIYRWAGAAPNLMASLAGTRRILDRSMRVPRAIHRIAEDVISRVKNRVQKRWHPRDEYGEIRFAGVGSWDPGPPNYGSWLVMARTRRALMPIGARLEHLGVPYISDGNSAMARPGVVSIILYERLRRGESITWEEFLILRKHISARFDVGADDFRPETIMWRDLTWPSAIADRAMTWLDAVAARALRVPERDVSFVRRVRERGESLTAKPRVTVSTIHGIKGAESDHAFLLTDTSRAAARSMVHDLDDEHRVFYVAVTRARKTLTIAPPTRSPYYEI